MPLAILLLPLGLKDGFQGHVKRLDGVLGSAGLQRSDPVAIAPNRHALTSRTDDPGQPMVGAVVVQKPEDRVGSENVGSLHAPLIGSR